MVRVTDPTWRSASSSRWSRSAASSTSSARSTMAAATCARSWSADGSIGAIERTAPAGDWRTNVSRGGSVRAVRSSVRVGAAWRCARPRRSAPTTPASICCRRGTAGCSCSRSTAFRDGRGCSRRRASTSPAAIVDHLVERVRAAGGGGTPSSRRTVRHDRIRRPDRLLVGERRCRCRAARLPARSQRAEARQRVARSPLRGHAVRGFSRQRRRDRRAARAAPADRPLGATIRLADRGDGALDARRTPTSASCCLLAPLAKGSAVIQ